MLEVLIEERGAFQRRLNVFIPVKDSKSFNRR